MSIFLVRERFLWDGVSNMKRDEFLLKEAGILDKKSCFLRMYGWEVNTISIGRNQKISKLDLEKIQMDGIDCVRRITGGGAVWHDANQITYSVAGPSQSKIFGDTIESSFAKIGECLLDFAKNFFDRKDLGGAVEKKRTALENFSNQYVCFASTGMYEIVVKKKKWIGSAQKRTKESFVQHGSILLKTTQKNLRKYFLEAFPALDGDEIGEIGLWDFVSEEARNELEERRDFVVPTQKILEWLQESFEKVLGEKIDLYDLAM